MTMSQFAEEIPVKNIVLVGLEESLARVLEKEGWAVRWVDRGDGVRAAYIRARIQDGQTPVKVVAVRSRGVYPKTMWLTLSCDDGGRDDNGDPSV